MPLRSCVREVCTEYRIGLTYAFPVSKGGGSSSAWPPLGVPCRFFSFNTCPTPFIFLPPSDSGNKKYKATIFLFCLFSLVHVQVHTINNNNVHKKEVKGSGRSRLFSGFALLAGVILIWICGINFINLSRFLRWMNLRRILRLGPFSLPKCVAHLFIYIFRR